ncbi:MAG: right-handed parallel beta-helix repeat-containing protein, partial [Gammaproteobacteria bacterium]
VQGSLRQFIQNAVAISGPNAMRFVPVDPTNATDGGGNDWWSVPVTVALPTASSAATTIDGTAYQLSDGASPRNTNALGPELELNGTGTAATVDGLLVTGGTSAVRDLVFNRFGRNGILITTAGNNTIAGNYLGTDATGSADLGNGNDGIRILSVPGNTIGGLNPGDRNVISGNGNNGLLIDGVAATGNIIQGNYVGLNAAGTAAIGNFDDGVDLSDTPGNTVGGTDPAARNVISGQGDIGLLFVGAQSTGNVAVNNYIGTNAAGDAAVPNLTGVSAYNDAAGNRIGGVNGNEANLIAFNTGDGVWIQATAGVNNSVLRNSIHTNGGLGIDTEADGVHINTLADPLNLPVITAASESAGTVTVDFDLDVPAGDYRIEFFTNLTADPSGNGEGQTFATFYDLVGHPGVPTSFSVPLAGAGWVNLTATTTKDLGAGSFGSTSEFSNAFVVVRDTLVVNSTGDAADANPGDGVCFTSGTNFDGDPECTLRAAIEESNALAGADTVNFNIPITEPGYTASPLAFTLNPASQYPVVTGQVTLDATSQPQYTGDPIIQLDGTLAIGATAGLVIGGSNNTVAGFILHSFEDEGLEVDGSPGPADNNTLRNNWIGLDASGTILGNDGNGILLTEAADGNMIGGTGLNDGNVIAGSGDRGINIRVNSVGNTVIGNSVYGNTQLGIDLDEDGVTANDL